MKVFLVHNLIFLASAAAFCRTEVHLVSPSATSSLRAIGGGSYLDSLERQTKESSVSRVDSVAACTNVSVTSEINAGNPPPLRPVEVSASKAVHKTDEAVVANADKVSEVQKMMTQIKEAGAAGIISYALWEFGFWALSIPVVLFGYFQFTGHMPDFSDRDDVSKLGAGTWYRLW